MTHDNAIRAGSRQAGRFVVAGVFMLLLTLLGACARNVEERASRPKSNAHIVSGQTMGTRWRVTIDPPIEPAQHAALRNKIDDLLEAVESQMSHWRPDSLISEINRDDTCKSFILPKHFSRVLVEAERLYHDTDGYLDVTVGPIVDAWGFGPDTPAQIPPTVSTMSGARASTGMDKLSLTANSEGTFTLTKRDPRARLDLSSIAKGYAVDCVAELCRSAGHHNCLVEIGGEVRACGTRAGGQLWRIGIERPQSGPAQEVVARIAISDASVATSGDYRRFHRAFSDPATRYTHVIDPSNGAPVDHDLASVSVLHASAMTADALATALFVMGPQAGYRFAQQHAIEAIFMERRGNDIAIRATTTTPLLAADSKAPPLTVQADAGSILLK